MDKIDDIRKFFNKFTMGNFSVQGTEIKRGNGFSISSFVYLFNRLQYWVTVLKYPKVIVITKKLGLFMEVFNLIINQFEYKAHVRRDLLCGTLL